MDSPSCLLLLECPFAIMCITCLHMCLHSPPVTLHNRLTINSSSVKGQPTSDTAECGIGSYELLKGARDIIGPYNESLPLTSIVLLYPPTIMSL
uniref:Uncharacterized protein n=1 Tax=Amphimedon queenslandica TaxID=400682 RepID=A0A1X7U2S5_AMPQE